MYKELRTTLINGPTFSGKTSFIRRYIDEVINDDVKLYLVDFKMVELFSYKDYDNVTYITSKEEMEEGLFKEINYRLSCSDNSDKQKIYIFIDEYYEVKCVDGFHKLIKDIMKNKTLLNLEVICTTQIANAFCPGMKSSADTIIKLNRNN